MIGILVLTLTAFILSIILTIVSAIVTREDSLIEEVEKMLPGLNCGGCGYGSCKGMACEILKNNIEAYQNCRPLRGEKKEKLEEYLRNTIKNEKN